MRGKKLSRKIKTKKRGNALGFWLFKICLKVFGLCGAYALVYVVCLYYLIFDHSAVSAASAYINKRFLYPGFFKKQLHIYRLFVSQGKQLIDRYALLAKGEIFDIRICGYEQLMSLVKDTRQGVIIVTAHAGNWQVAMTCLRKMKRKIYLLMRPEDNRAVQNSLHISAEYGDIRIISPENELGGVFEIMKVLQEGHVVSIMGDRRYGFKALEVSFLGEKAWFPYGAFSIAAAVECPVVVLLSAKVSAHTYIIDVSNVFYPRYTSRENKRQQLSEWVQNYVDLLERYVKQYPYQCFLFHDVWLDGSHDTTQ